MEIDMGGLLLAIDMLLQQGEGMAVKHYGDKHKVGGMFFNAVICLFSTLFFIITDKGGLCFTNEMLVYGLISCCMFALGFYSMYVALQIGSYVATKMIASFSGVISIVYGIAFLKEPASVFTYIGIVLVFISTVLMRYKKSENDEKKKVSFKWIVWTLITAVSNGFIAVISREQQLHFNNAYDNEFMILSFGGAFVALCIIGFIYERENFKYIAKHGIVWGLLAGACNGGKNLVNLLIYLYIPISIATPLRTGLGFITSFLVSVLLYKEKFTKLQLLSVFLGIFALVLFKL